MPATIMGLLDLPDDGLFPGSSLQRYWIEPGRKKLKNLGPVLSELSHAPWRGEWAPVSKGDMKSLAIGDMHYILNGDGSEEVYNLRLDPTEQHDLSQTARGTEAATQARHILKQIIR
jgi:hypothetical protein